MEPARAHGIAQVRRRARSRDLSPDAPGEGGRTRAARAVNHSNYGYRTNGTITMRVYRGLKQPYKPEKCSARISAPAQLQGTDFTDCPYAALLYAHGPRGVVLVVDVGPGDPVQVSEELWPGMRDQPIMVWGILHQFTRAVFPAKETSRGASKEGHSISVRPG
jgi:hypothetical protein